MAQQKGQYQPGQYGLNAGVLPDPGVTYVNLSLNYSTGQLNFANGDPTRVRGTYAVWAMEAILSPGFPNKQTPHAFAVIVLGFRG
jgi:hypothetical protein